MALINKNYFICFYSCLILLYFTLTLSMNCLKLKPPPITFTQSQTAAEKQMIGSDRELESDGWYISSIKTSAHEPNEWRKNEIESHNEQNFEFSSLLKILTYTNTEIKLLKKMGYIGEGLDGTLHIQKEIPIYFSNTYKTNEEKKRVVELIQLVNKSRLELYKLKESEQPSKDFRKVFYNEVEPGELYEYKSNNWIMKE
jgi:hypothetical protein